LIGLSLLQSLQRKACGYTPGDGRGVTRVPSFALSGVPDRALPRNAPVLMGGRF
jgi:hypothetical protein